MIFLFGLFLYSSLLASQKSGGGEYIHPTQNEACLTPSQRNQLVQDLINSQRLLKQQGKLLEAFKNNQHPLFIWPVKQSDAINYNEIWAISNYVDHNTEFPNKVTDYNGGSKSYDTENGYNHRGLDIFIWPYSWNMVDQNGLTVIAAAPGQIIFKRDGQFDRSCSLNGNQWNAIYIQHSDGSVAWYGHLKEGSLTSKEIGATVATGEYLGVVASSGNSTGPHLHFEVFEDDSYQLDKLIDPYAGPFNNLNEDTWWAAQKPYRNPTINALTTNTDQPNFAACPQSVTINEKNQFAVNELVYFTVFLKDQLGQNFNLTVYRPDQSVAYSWSRELANDYASSYWYYSRAVDVEGQWEVKCELSTGQVLTHSFQVGNQTLTIEEKQKTDQVRITPNPVHHALTIQSEEDVNSLIIRDALGKKVYQDSRPFSQQKVINLEDYASGLYFVSVNSQNQKVQTFKILKE